MTDRTINITMSEKTAELARWVFDMVEAGGEVHDFPNIIPARFHGDSATAVSLLGQYYTDHLLKIDHGHRALATAQMVMRFGAHAYAVEQVLGRTPTIGETLKLMHGLPEMHFGVPDGTTLM